jgi:predicted ester cyclase
MPSDTMRNKELIRELLAHMDAGRLDVIERYYAASYVDRSPTALRSGPPGCDALRAAVERMYAAFPDTVHTIDDLVAEGDRVAARITARGTFTGPLFGHPPTGAIVEMTSVVIYRIANGQIAERWASGHGLLEALGISRSERRDSFSEGRTL